MLAKPLASLRACRVPPDAVDAKLHAAALAALKDPAVAARMESQAGFIIGGGAPPPGAGGGGGVKQEKQRGGRPGGKPPERGTGAPG